MKLNLVKSNSAISGCFIALLSNEELDPESKLIKNKINSKQKAEDLENATLIYCPRCKGKATYRLRQTRSADEPMTLFCKCTVCKKEWKQ